MRRRTPFAVLNAVFGVGVATDIGVLKDYSQLPREYSDHGQWSETLWEAANSLIDAEFSLYAEIARNIRSTLVFDGGSIPPVDFPSQGVSVK